MIEKTVFKIGIIGAGKIVESNHLPVLLNIPGVSVSWIFDKSNTRTDLLSIMYNVAVVTEQELEDKIRSIDICLIAIPYGVRDKYIRMCAALKKCVYVEKPFATTANEHKLYCDLFAEPDIAIGFQRRYYQFITDIKYIIQSNLFGKLLSVNFNQGYFQIKGGSGFLSDAKLSGGGVIIESAIHTLDQILQFTNAEALEVNEVKTLASNGIDYDTVFSTTIKTGNNNLKVLCHISCLKNLDNGLHIEFENAVIHFQPAPAPTIFVTARENNKTFQLGSFQNEQTEATSVNASFVMFWKDYISAIQSRIPNRTSAVNSRLTTLWIGQLYNKINRSDK